MKTIKINTENNDILEGIVEFIQSKFKATWKSDTSIEFIKGKRERFI